MYSIKEKMLIILTTSREERATMVEFLFENKGRATKAQLGLTSKLI